MDCSYPGIVCFRGGGGDDLISSEQWTVHIQGLCVLEVGEGDDLISSEQWTVCFRGGDQ